MESSPFSIQSQQKCILSVDYQVDSLNSCTYFEDQCIISGISNLQGNFWDGKVILLSLSGRIIAEKSFNSGVSLVRTLPSDTSLFLTSTDDGIVSVVSLKSEAIPVTATTQAHDDIITSISFNPSNTNIFSTTGFDSVLNLWDVNNTADPIVSINEAHYGHIYEAAYKPQDSNILATTGVDGFCRIWGKIYNKHLMHYLM